MARTADFRDLISGKLVTTGTGTAYVLASLQTPAFDTLAHMDGQMFAFVPNVTNTGPVTLAVDGLTAKPIRSQTGAAGDLGSGTLILGTPYVVTYYNSVGEFILQGFVGTPLIVPIGALLFLTYSPSLPNSNFVFPIGQAISRSTYSIYFGLVGTYYGVGDGSTTFNIPDLRSRMIIPTATMGGGADPGLVTTAGSGINGALIGATGGVQNITLDSTMIPSHSHSITDPGHTHTTSLPLTNATAAGANFAGGSGAANRVATIDAASTGITTTNATGGSQAHNNMPPSIVLPVILRIL